MMRKMIKILFLFKKPIRTGLILLIVFLIFSFNGAEEKNHSSAIIYSSIQLKIAVKTNTFCFSCDHATLLKDTIKFLFNQEDKHYYIKNNQYKIPVKKIDCHNSLRNKDMHEMLKADKYPFIIFTLNNYLVNRDSQNGGGNASISICIAGVEKKYSINFIEIKKDDYSSISGSFTINLNDFNIDPPSKLFGMVEVDKMIVVSISANTKFNKVNHL